MKKLTCFVEVYFVVVVVVVFFAVRFIRNSKILSSLIDSEFTSILKITFENTKPVEK
jgi:hypothetical protein